MPSVREYSELQRTLLLLPAKLRDMYIDIGMLVPELDPDAGLGAFQPVHIKEQHEISDEDALKLCERFEFPLHHYLILRARNLDIIGKVWFAKIIEGEKPPSRRDLVSGVGAVLPNFNKSLAERTMLNKK
jgi:hypothetical protein